MGHKRVKGRNLDVLIVDPLISRQNSLFTQIHKTEPTPRIIMAENEKKAKEASGVGPYDWLFLAHLEKDKEGSLLSYVEWMLSRHLTHDNKPSRIAPAKICITSYRNKEQIEEAIELQEVINDAAPELFTIYFPFSDQIWLRLNEKREVSTGSS